MEKKFSYQVAMFVGAALNHSVPRGNGQGYISTINVSQYKTKFNDIRIYCDLANPQLISDLWSHMGKSGEPSDQFIDQCLFFDAQHYRNCYLSMLDILNNEDIKKSLKEPASYPELLFREPIELDAFLNERKEKSKQYHQYENLFATSWRVNDFDSLRKLLYKISGFGEAN